MKQFAPAAERNRIPIAGVLDEVLPNAGLVLEIASGTGQHATFFARRLPRLRWQPSEVDATALESIEAYRSESNLDNLLPPVELDVRSFPWPLNHADAIVCINMIHIAEWDAAVALFRGAARLLGSDAPLILYGPYRFDGKFTAPSNAEFDQSLRSRNPEWGVRDLGDLENEARRHGFVRHRVLEMPANNHVVVLHRTADPARPIR